MTKKIMAAFAVFALVAIVNVGATNVANAATAGDAPANPSIAGGVLTIDGPIDTDAWNTYFNGDTTAIQANAAAIAAATSVVFNGTLDQLHTIATQLEDPNVSTAFDIDAATTAKPVTLNFTGTATLIQADIDYVNNYLKAGSLTIGSGNIDATAVTSLGALDGHTIVTGTASVTGLAPALISEITIDGSAVVSTTDGRVFDSTGEVIAPDAVVDPEQPSAVVAPDEEPIAKTSAANFAGVYVLAALALLSAAGFAATRKYIK